MFDRNQHPNPKPVDLALYRLFPNYAGLVENAAGEYPVSFLELSRPTGKYVSRLILRELNLFIRRHSIIMIGNTCAPGYFFPQVSPCIGMEQFSKLQNLSCGVFIANVMGQADYGQHGVVFEAEPFMLLKIRQGWNHLEDYLNAMTSKYRIRAKKVFELSNNLQVTEYTGESIDPKLLHTCAILLQETLKEKTLVMNKNLGGIMQRFAEHFGQDFKIRVYFKNEVPVGFISYSVRNGVLHAWHVGYQAEIAKATHIYQRMLYDLVEIAILTHCKTLNFGRTATEIKSTLGAEPLANHFVVFMKSKLLRSLLRYYKKRHYRPKEYTLRRPFR